MVPYTLIIVGARMQPAVKTPGLYTVVLSIHHRTSQLKGNAGESSGTEPSETE